jgi:Holliday junction resolvase RusA-like endonuclease
VRSIRFDIPGTCESNNANTRVGNGRGYKPKKAREYQERVRDAAKVAAILADWEIPDLAMVAIYLHKQRLDWDNAPKMTQDALRGILIVDDKPEHCLGGTVMHVPGATEKKVVVVVYELDAAKVSVMMKALNL